MTNQQCIATNGLNRVESSGDRPDIRGRSKHSRSRTTHGFTLMETALAIVIVGTGVLSILYAQTAFHNQNEWSSRLATGNYLANEIREMTLRMPRHDPVTGRTYWGPEDEELFLDDFDDLDDYDGTAGEGVIFSADDGSGPVNSMREVIPNMTGWSQIIRVFNVDPQDISAAGDDAMDGTTDMMRVEVIVTYQGPNDAESLVIDRLVWFSED